MGNFFCLMQNIDGYNLVFTGDQLKAILSLEHGTLCLFDFGDGPVLHMRMPDGKYRAPTLYETEELQLILREARELFDGPNKG